VPFAGLPASGGPAEAWLPRPYPQLLRGPGYRPWRPLLSVAVLVAVGAIGIVVLGVVGALVLALTGRATADGAAFGAWSVTPTGLLVTNLGLAALIPAAQVAVWVGFGWRPRWVASVTGGVRWGWLLRCYAVCVAVVGVVLVGVTLLADDGPWRPEASWPWLALVVITTTPLQAAGEEYLFRGWLPLTLGSVFARRGVGAVVGGAVSTTLFALAHGQQDPWLFGDRFLFGAAASWLAWRTGGLEAGMAMHGANNLVAFAITIAQGGLADTLTATESTPASLVLDVATVLLTVGAVVLLARRDRIVRLFTPPVRFAAPP
jgi:membrane protease YdiL (CAAX protease family)